MKSSLRSVSLIGIIVLLASAFGGITPVKANPVVFINEIHYDNTGTDSGEAIEIAGPAGTDLSGWSLVLYNGNGGGVYNTTAMSGSIPDMGTGFGFVVVTYATNGIQNGSPDGLALVDNFGVVVQFLSYEGSFTAADGPAAGQTSDDIGVYEPYTTPIGESLQLTGSGTTYSDFSWSAPAPNTLGSINPGQSFVLDYTPVYDIQYTLDPSGDSPYKNQADVTTEGIVTTIYANGYFIEDASGGAWSGLYVYDSNGPMPGDRLRLSGTVVEYYGLTELKDLTEYVVESSGNAIPGPDAVASGDVTQEQWEGVLVRVENVTVTDPDLGYGEWSVSDGSGDVIIDDKGSYTYVPSAGDALDAVIGPLDYAYGAFKIQPRDDADIIFGINYTPIYDIQYTLDPSGDSPYKNYEGVTTEGVVTATFLYGYFIEDPASGAWNGLWVHDTTNAPTIGDHVRLTGTVLEYYNLTELDALTGYDLVSSGNPIPGPDVVATGDVSQEQWEGVLVRVENVNVTNEDLGYGEWSVSDGTGDVVIDDKGAYTYAPATGDSLDAVTGPLDYAYGAFKIQPRDDSDISKSIQLAVINEFLADPASGLAGDANGDGVRHYGDDEFIEIVNISGSDLDLSGWTLADGFGVRHVFTGGTVVPADCVIVVFGGATPIGDFGGGTVQTASTGSLGLNNSGDSITLSDGLTQISLSYGSEGGDNQSLTLYPDVSGDFVKHSNAVGSGGSLFSPGTMIDGSQFSGCDLIFGACTEPATFIHQVQGSGAASPMVAMNVVLEGIVVGDFQTSAHLRGFFLQEEVGDADGDPMTSEGIFVYDGSSPAVDVLVGDLIRVMGSVTEYYGLTELTSVSDVEVCGTGTVSAATVTLPVSSMDVWEQVEGMLINIPQTLFATDNYKLGLYGEVTLSAGGRLYNPTNVVSPGPAAIALQDLNDRSLIQLEDGSTSSYPSPMPYSPDGTLRAGDTIPSLTGVLHYSYGAYEVHPTGAVEFARGNARPSEPPEVGGDITVASFNVLNYFTTIDNSGPICGPTGGMDCRGADSADEFTRQRTKIISAVLALDADVVGLMEIENHPSDAAVQDLVSGLNDIAGAGTYAYVDTGTIGTDAIKVAFIYKPASITLAGSYAVLDSSVDPTFIDTKNRPALVQTFEEVGSGARFTAVVNHLKSKGSDCNSLGDPDTDDGQGNCNLTRTSAANALVNWLSTDPTMSGDPDFIILGDLNAYAMEDPVAAITGAGYTNLIYEYEGAEAYSYVYYGQVGYLDHALTNSSLMSQVQGAAVWHINADEPSALDYNDNNQVYLYSPDPYRASDHDPVLVGLNPNAVPVCSGAYPSVDLLWPANHKFISIEMLGVTDGDGDVLTITIDSIFQDEMVDDGGDGSTWPDGQGVGTSIAEVRAERAADGNGRVYHITFSADDGHGGTCSGEVLVGVPHDSGQKTEMPVDDGANYDSTLEPEAMIVPEVTEEPTEEPDDKDKKDK